MSRWEDFATTAGHGLAEDQTRITSPEEYALFQESTFLKVAEAFLILPSNLNPNHFSDVVLHPMKSYKNHTLRTQELTFAYHGFGSVRYGKAIVSETMTPRGFRISRLWHGERAKDRKWISWNEAVRNMFTDDLLWT